MSLYNKIVDMQKLNAAWTHVKKKHPANGVDHVTIEDFEKNKKQELYQLHSDLINRNYKSMPVKLVALHRENRERMVSLFCMRDKVIQQSMAEELSKLYEPLFCRSSYAYRSGKSALDAVNILGIQVKNFAYFLKLDIKAFFDSINQKKLMEMLKQQIHDDNVLWLLEQMIQAEMLDMKTGKLERKTVGLYQGSAASPVLSNIYLMSFDRVFEQKSKVYIRYSDDVLILGNSEDEMDGILSQIKNMLRDLSLELQEDKTVLGKVADGFEFLGYAFDCRGQSVSKKAEDGLEKRLENMWLTDVHASVKEKLKKGSEIVGGWEQYYREKRTPGNIIEYAVVLYMMQNKPEREELAELRFQYTNIYRDLLDFFVEIWKKWNRPEYERREYEQFYNADEYDREVLLDCNDIRHNELLMAYRKFALFADQEEYEELIQIYSDLRCYNRAAFFMDKKKEHTQMAQTQILRVSAPCEQETGNLNFTQQDIAVYMDLFVGREDLYALESADEKNRRKLKTLCEVLSENVVKQHIAGKMTVSTYVQRPNATVKYMIMDLDVSKHILLKYGAEQTVLDGYMKKAGLAAQCICRELRNTGLQSYVEFSGCRGYHIWVFFSEWIPVRYINMLQDYIMGKIAEQNAMDEKENSLQIEFFPNKARVRADRTGQCMKMPYGIHSKTGKLSYFLDNNFQSVNDLSSFMNNIRKYSLETLKKILSARKTTGIIQEKPMAMKAGVNLSDYGNLSETVKLVLTHCDLMRYLCGKAQNTGYLTHFERLSVLYVFGHLGEDGCSFVHSVMEHTMNYQYHITEKFIRKLPEKPISCIKLRERYKTVSAEYGCNCKFKHIKKCYPSPVLHAIQDAKDMPADITMPLSRTLTSENEKKVLDEINVHKRVQDMAERILTLKKQKRGIDKSIEKLERDLEKVFDETGTDCVEIEMGLLVRRKTEQGYEWLVEL